TGRWNPGRRSIAVVPVAHRPLDCRKQMGGCRKTERDRVSDVEIADAPARLFDPLRLDDDIPNGIRKARDSVCDRDLFERGWLWHFAGNHQTASYRDLSG